MTVTAVIRLLVVTDDSLFSDYTLAAVDRYPDMSVACVSTLSAARSKLATGSADCVVLDTDLSEHGIQELHRSVSAERPQLPVVLAADCARSALSMSQSYHAFVRKQGPAMGTSLADVVRVLAADTPTGHGPAPAAAE